eukprot:TRINITY_DN3568_c0_g1_i2.p1 TRINITY_DN3568_c0_g1~~TRINITY_DN3568_c0_g1_i2.p1  ORF type:complete len:609 (-),score=126.44 TRINITY_DN3568_c0_g1_i2:291-2117(-)
MNAEVYLSSNQRLQSNFFNTTHPPPGVTKLAVARDIPYTYNMPKHSYKITLSGKSNSKVASDTQPTKNKSKSVKSLTQHGPEEEVVEVVSPVLWRHLQSNGTVYLHVFMSAGGASPDWNSQRHSTLATLHNVLPLSFYGPKPDTKPLRLLLKESWREAQEAHARKHSQVPPVISYWKPQAAVRIVCDWTEFPERYVPNSLAESWEIVGLNRYGRQVDSNWDKLAYKPVVHVDETGLTTDMYMPINDTLSSLPLHLTVEPVGLPRWQLMQALQGALATQKEAFGFSDKDIDEMRRMIIDTNLYLLAVTMVVSMLHLLFEFLAFKSDVQFWKKNKSLRGLSVGSIAAELVFQAVIVLYLIEDDSSILVTAPTVVGVILQAWKLRRATGLTLQRRGDSMLWLPVMPRLDRERAMAAKGAKGSGPDAGQDYDRVAITYLSLLLLPGVVGFSLRSLLTERYTGWYSWAIRSLTGCVYTLGFVLMTPQLYINYKLRSVAHLPWRFLCYRFLNTGIDDLFSFIIRMPVMHRVSCFRDDLVFIAYLYQRWTYPTDTSRAMAVEDGGTGEVEGEVDMKPEKHGKEPQLPQQAAKPPQLTEKRSNGVQQRHKPRQTTK